MKTIEAVGVALINEHHQIFIAQRPSHKAMGDKWEFPGGKREAGESLEACIIREIKEELGVDICLKDYLGYEVLKKTDTITLHLYTGYINDTRPITLHEHQQSAWVSLDALSEYDFPAIDLPFIKKLRQQLTSPPLH